MRRPLVAGNWKMNGTRASVAELILGLCRVDCVSCVDVAVLPSCLHIAQVVEGLKGTAISVGAQDCSMQSHEGALSGEVASSQLVDAGCAWVLVGHSERRHLLGEDDELVARKFIAAQAGGLIPVLCVGETLAQRNAGKTLDVIARQVNCVVGAVGVEAFSRAVVAYEPVWAIGTGLAAGPDQAQEVHAAIRAQFGAICKELAQNLRILYGGSVKSSNAVELFGMPDVDGGLIGGASLNAEEFGAICRAAGS